MTKENNEATCALCGKPLADEQWIDHDEYGDVHERCAIERHGE